MYLQEAGWCLSSRASQNLFILVGNIYITILGDLFDVACNLFWLPARSKTDINLFIRVLSVSESILPIQTHTIYIGNWWITTVFFKLWGIGNSLWENYKINQICWNYCSMRSTKFLQSYFLILEAAFSPCLLGANCCDNIFCYISIFREIIVNFNIFNRLYGLL